MNKYNYLIAILGGKLYFNGREIICSTTAYLGACLHRDQDRIC